MSLIIEEIKSRFGAENVKTVFFTETENKDLAAYPFITAEIQMRSKITLLMTNGLSDYKMPVLEKSVGREFNELCFCLPSYWDLNDQSNPNMKWVFEILFRLQKHVLEKQTWFGIGHTIPFTNPITQISPLMRQKYFFLSEPIFLQEQLQPMVLEGKTIHFLMIVPIFEDEFDYKLGKGTYKFQKKMAQHNVTELLDDFRSTVLKSKWRFFGK